MKRLFLDTEFTELSPLAKLISISLVSEDGDEFYAELTDTWRQEDLSEFSAQHVVPLLDGRPLMTWTEVCFALHAWISKQGPCIIALDSLRYDFAWLLAILRDPALEMVREWPANLEKVPLVLSMNYLKNFELFEEILMRELDGLRRHHARDDAIANLRAWKGSGGDTLQK